MKLKTTFTFLVSCQLETVTYVSTKKKRHKDRNSRNCPFDWTPKQLHNKTAQPEVKTFLFSQYFYPD